jgi:hypothetical protein
MVEIIAIDVKTCKVRHLRYLNWKDHALLAGRFFIKTCQVQIDLIIKQAHMMDLTGLHTCDLPYEVWAKLPEEGKV